MAATQWTAGDIPGLHGQAVVVTGGNSGIGYEAALALAGKGARVVLAVRKRKKGRRPRTRFTCPSCFGS